jgi:hypothetical protein
MDSADPNAATDGLSLLSAAKTRIDTAMSEIVLITRGVTDATTAQNVAISEIREARNAIRKLREQLGRQA